MERWFGVIMRSSAAAEKGGEGMAGKIMLSLLLFSVCWAFYDCKDFFYQRHHVLFYVHFFPRNRIFMPGCIWYKYCCIILSS